MPPLYSDHCRPIVCVRLSLAGNESDKTLSISVACLNLEIFRVSAGLSLSIYCGDLGQNTRKNKERVLYTFGQPRRTSHSPEGPTNYEEFHAWNPIGSARSALTNARLAPIRSSCTISPEILIGPPEDV